MFQPAERITSPALWVFLLALGAAIVVGVRTPPAWTVVQVTLEVKTDDQGQQFVSVHGENRSLTEAIPLAESPLTLDNLSRLPSKGEPPKATEQLVFESVEIEGQSEKHYFHQSAYRHWGFWSFLPALTAIVLCWLTREPISALLAGIVVGALLMGKLDVLEGVLIPAIGTPAAATILVLYLWLLGGLLGVWARTGASEAFAHYMSRRFVRGPRSAKLVAWLLGVVFFQGGTISAVLVGTTVRPLADKEKVSHEELSLIVDATASPVAVLLAFNAWPLYVQAFMGVVGVSYLATVGDRVAFFFHSIPLSFYAIFTVLFTLLMALEKHPLLPEKLMAARRRARNSGQLDAPGAEPLAYEDHRGEVVPAGYAPSVLDFVLPLLALLGIAIGTYWLGGSPQIVWAFAAALVLAAAMAWSKGMNLRQVVAAILDGQKSILVGLVILLLAITIGKLSQDVGGGHYLASLLGGLQWHWGLPAAAFLIAGAVAFATGSSWATFAVTLPLVMPLAHAVATSQGLTHPQLYLSLCFAATLNGGVFGDQCSPISDTTILSSMCTCADLMDHVTTQLPVALQAAVLALVGWTALALACV